MPVAICAGDSITYGLWAKSSRWSELLRVWLESRSLEGDLENLNTNSYVAVYNLGIPGDTSQGLLKRFDAEVGPRVNSDQEMVIIIAIGTNDARFIKSQNRYESTADQTVANIRSLIGIARKLTRKILVLGLPPVDEARTNPIFWDTNYSYTNQDLESYNRDIKTLTIDEGIAFADMFTEMKEFKVPELMEDGIHPNAEGHRIMFEAVKRVCLEKKLL